MRGIGLMILMIAAFILTFLYLKSSGINSIEEEGNPKTQYERVKKVEEAVEDFNKATEQRMKDLENID